MSDKRHSTGGSSSQLSKARVNPTLARIALEARDAANQALEAAKLAEVAAGEPEQVAEAREVANQAQDTVKKVERELAVLEAAGDVEHKNYSTARMDANRLRTNQDQAESEAKQAHATALKVTGTLDAAKLAFAEALEKKDQAEGFAATKWDEAAAAAERGARRHRSGSRLRLRHCYLPRRPWPR